MYTDVYIYIHVYIHTHIQYVYVCVFLYVTREPARSWLGLFGLRDGEGGVQALLLVPGTLAKSNIPTFVRKMPH